MARLEHVIARNLIELREEKGVTQSEVAALMRANGYAWQTNRVTQIETLRRPVSLLEVVGLSRVFFRPVSRLLAGYDDIDLPDGSTMTLAEVRDALAGVDRPAIWTPTPEEMEQHQVNTDDLRKIAKSVGRPVPDVDAAAYRIFGKSLFAERDERAGDLNGMSARSARTKRGHVTRQLVTEMRDYFAELDAAAVQDPAHLRDVEFLTVEQVAQKMHVSKMTVYRLVHGGELPAIRAGRSFRVTEQDVDEYQRRQRDAG